VINAKDVEISDTQKALDAASTAAIEANEASAAKDVLIAARGASIVSLTDDKNRLTSEISEKIITIDDITAERDVYKNTVNVCATACDDGLMKSGELSSGFQQPRSKRTAVGQNAAPVAKSATFAGAVAAAAPSAAPGASRSAGAVKKGINPSFANNPISVSRFEKGECFKCGQQGHKKDNCPMAAPPSKK
jgi:hypothetical protein